MFISCLFVDFLVISRNYVYIIYIIYYYLYNIYDYCYCTVYINT